MFEIKDIKADIEDKEILKGVSLTIKPVKFMLLWDPTDLEKVHLQKY